MSCCEVHPLILRSYTEVRGDRSPDTETEVFTVLVMQCRNPSCLSYQKIYEERIPMPLGEAPMV